MVLTSIMAIVSATLLFSSPAGAQEAQWQGASIMYNGDTYVGPMDSDTVDRIGLPDGSHVYAYLDQSAEYMHVLSFAPDENPERATQATYQNYEHLGSGRYGPANDTATVEVNEEPLELTSCNIEGNMGWIICPITNTLAGWMDGVFSVLVDFLEVRPLQTDDAGNAVYRAWGYMRNFANIAFVIAFLIIVYSQLTSIGISNYSIKKLIPRLIISAVAVNASYIICAIFIDLSNLLGLSFQGWFIDMRNNLVDTEGNQWELVSWSSVASFVLSGGTAAVAAGIGVSTAVLSAGGVGAAALAILIPSLLSGLLAVIIALIIMASRQALMTILTVLAPLAFVAYLLPNTEQWFNRWRSLFTTMLVLFPAFSVVFGGAQLAGAIIIQNATSINILILGLLVQVAPMFITPLLIKLSGSLLARLAGMANNPGRGLVNKTRDWGQDRAAARKADLLQRQAPKGARGSWHRKIQAHENTQRTRNRRRSAHESLAEARWKQSQSFSDIAQVEHQANDLATMGDTNAQVRYDQSKLTNAELQKLDVDVRTVKLNAENAKTETDLSNWENNHSVPVVQAKLANKVVQEAVDTAHAQHNAEYEEFKHGHMSQHMQAIPRAAVDSLMGTAQDNSRRLALNAMRNESAKRAIDKNFADELRENHIEVDGIDMQHYAGGVEKQGAERALASALSTQAKVQKESIANANAIIEYGNYTDKQVSKLAIGDVTDTGLVAVSEDIRLAALQRIASGGNADEILNLTRELSIDGTSRTQDDRQILYDSLMSNKSRPTWMPAGVMAGIKDGTAPAGGAGRIDEWVKGAVEANAFSSAQTLVSEDRSYLRELNASLKRIDINTIDPRAREKLKESIEQAFADNRYSQQMGKRRNDLEELANITGARI